MPISARIRRFMAKQKKKKGDAHNLSPEDFYNLLMYDIEPDLVTSRLPHLEAIYFGESEDERIKRGERYSEAFDKFLLKFHALTDAWKSALLTFKDAIIGDIKREGARSDAAALSRIEESFDQA